MRPPPAAVGGTPDLPQRWQAGSRSGVRVSSGWSSAVGGWLGSLPARESGKPELISGADRLVCCKASQVCDKTGMDATNSVVERACVAEASLPARESGKP